MTDDRPRACTAPPWGWGNAKRGEMHQCIICGGDFITFLRDELECPRCRYANDRR